MSLNNIYATPRLPEIYWPKLAWASSPLAAAGGGGSSRESEIVTSCLIGDLSRLVLNFENKRVNKQRFK